MQDQPSDHLRIMGELAREYQQKSMELEEIVAQAAPGKLLHQIKLRGELTTDRFRAAQMVLLSTIVPGSEKESDDTLKAALALCRCFDELRILFQFLLEHCSTDKN